MSRSVGYIDILGVHVSAINISAACAQIERWIKEEKKSYVCVAPVSTVVACQDDSKYLNVVNNADMVTPDGMPLVWLGKWMGSRTMARTYGPDLMLTVCQLSEKKGYKHYFYGATDETCRLLEDGLKRRFPKLNIAGRFSPPQRAAFTLESREVIEEINSRDPDILWVGLGSPKQDYWMFAHRGLLNAPVMIGVGAAFDFLSGVKKQAPRWMRQNGFEWLFRLGCEPGRLWKRYLIGNSRFIYLLVKRIIVPGAPAP